jgi:hypothetical protein
MPGEEESTMAGAGGERNEEVMLGSDNLKNLNSNNQTGPDGAKNGEGPGRTSDLDCHQGWRPKPQQKPMFFQHDKVKR